MLEGTTSVTMQNQRWQTVSNSVFTFDDWGKPKKYNLQNWKSRRPNLGLIIFTQFVKLLSSRATWNGCAALVSWVDNIIYSDGVAWIQAHCDTNGLIVGLCKCFHRKTYIHICICHLEPTERCHQIYYATNAAFPFHMTAAYVRFLPGVTTCKHRKNVVVSECNSLVGSLTKRDRIKWNKCYCFSI